jgi:hypothetical protein
VAIAIVAELAVRGGETPQLGKKALQALTVRVGGAFGNMVSPAVLEFELDEEIEFLLIQNAAAHGAVEKMPEEHQAFERIYGEIPIDTAFGLKHRRPHFVLRPFKGSPLDAPRDRERQVGLACAELLGIEKPQQGLQDLLRGVFLGQLRMAPCDGAKRAVHDGKKREKEQAIDDSIAENSLGL